MIHFNTVHSYNNNNNISHDHEQVDVNVDSDGDGDGDGGSEVDVDVVVDVLREREQALWLPPVTLGSQTIVHWEKSRKYILKNDEVDKK